MYDIATLKAQTNLIDLINPDTELRGGPAEYSGPCPRCGGTDRFHVHRDKGWFCRQCTGDPDGISGHWMDALDYIMWRDNVNFAEAYNRLGGPARLSADESAALLAERTARDQARRAEEQAHQNERRQVLDQSQAWRMFHENLDKFDKRPLWYERGLSDIWIDYYKLGYCENFTYRNGDREYSSETITIPTFAPDGDKWPCVGMAHRILTPDPAGGKYRPHLAGLGKSLFYTDPNTARLVGNVFLVEGEIKAAVTWAYLFDRARQQTSRAFIQVVGMAGKSFKQEWRAEFESARTVTIILDPDARRQAELIASTLGRERCWIIDLPGKVDDMLIDGDLQADDLFWMGYTARKVA